MRGLSTQDWNPSSKVRHISIPFCFGFAFWPLTWLSAWGYFF